MALVLAADLCGVPVQRCLVRMCARRPQSGGVWAWCPAARGSARCRAPRIDFDGHRRAALGWGCFGLTLCMTRVAWHRVSSSGPRSLLADQPRCTRWPAPSSSREPCRRRGPRMAQAPQRARGRQIGMRFLVGLMTADAPRSEVLGGTEPPSTPPTPCTCSHPTKPPPSGSSHLPSLWTHWSCPRSTVPAGFRDRQVLAPGEVDPSGPPDTL